MLHADDLMLWWSCALVLSGNNQSHLLILVCGIYSVMYSLMFLTNSMFIVRVFFSETAELLIGDVIALCLRLHLLFSSFFFN